MMPNLPKIGTLLMDYDGEILIIIGFSGNNWVHVKRLRNGTDLHLPPTSSGIHAGRINRFDSNGKLRYQIFIGKRP